MKKRGQILGSITLWVVLAAIFLFVAVTAYLIVSGKGSSIVARIQDLFRFGP